MYLLINLSFSVQSYTVEIKAKKTPGSPMTDWLTDWLNEWRTNKFTEKLHSSESNSLEGSNLQWDVCPCLYNVHCFMFMGILYIFGFLLNHAPSSLSHKHLACKVRSNPETALHCNFDICWASQNSWQIFITAPVKIICRVFAV